MLLQSRRKVIAGRQGLRGPAVHAQTPEAQLEDTGGGRNCWSSIFCLDIPPAAPSFEFGEGHDVILATEPIHLESQYLRNCGHHSRRTRVSPASQYSSIRATIPEKAGSVTSLKACRAASKSPICR